MSHSLQQCWRPKRIRETGSATIAAASGQIVARLVKSDATSAATPITAVIVAISATHRPVAGVKRPCGFSPLQRGGLDPSTGKARIAGLPELAALPDGIEVFVPDGSGAARGAILGAPAVGTVTGSLG